MEHKTRGAGLLLAMLSTLHASPASAAGTRNVLVLFSNARLLPANVEADGALRETLASSKGGPVDVFGEFLDVPNFEGERYAATVATYLREKYVARAPHAIVAGSDEALAFLLRHRAALFPEAPIVHMAVSRSRLRALQPLPADVVGVPSDFDFGGTIELALALHPEARRLVVVTGASAQDRDFEQRARHEVAPFAGRARAEFLSGLPTAALLERVKTLSPDAVVFTTGYFQDGGGRRSTPRESAGALARAAAVPVYGPFNTFLGAGVVGGRMPTFASIGRQAGEIVAAILEGTAPAALAIPSAARTDVHLDWRQVRRWGIRERDVPAGAVWYFREPTLWQSHRNWLIGAAAALFFQAALITGLVVERRLRRVAEQAVKEQTFQLAHASRLAVAGELTGSIAHEINQPLGAILSNADAADLILAAGGDRRDELRAILTDIRRDDLRASEVIRVLRASLARQEVEKAPFEINEAVREVEAVLGAEARKRRVALEIRPDARPVTFTGNRIQVQQVVINLVLNAMDAVEDMPDDRRRVSVSVAGGGPSIRITVRDRGAGIAPEDAPRVFQSFFTTKKKGMGLGLSIARTLVAAHGGRIWAESSLPDSGAAFFVELPGGEGTGSAA